jgi:type VI secretion system protein ImpF
LGSFDEQEHLVVREPRPIAGARAPLFERLADPGAGAHSGPTPPSVLDAAALREQVRGDLIRLLNTRCGLRGSQREFSGDTVLTYGMPDFSALSAASEADRNALAETVAKLIRRHEPRLAGVRVVLRTVPGSPAAVAGVIVAMLRTGPVPEPVSFQLAIDTRHSEDAVAVV